MTSILATSVKGLPRRLSVLLATLVLGAGAFAARAAQDRPDATTALSGLGFEALSERLPLTPQHEALLERTLLDHATREVARLDAAIDERKRFYALPSAAVGAFHLGRYELASRLADEALAMAASYPTDWNYGNAIHAGHTVRGLVALHDGDRMRAIGELHEAGATRGSPQLNSFGPSMSLARALLRAGESQAVIAYLEQCRVFWEGGDAWIAIWEEKIRAGAVPNFVMHRW
jgi:hypothetical protein